MTPALDLMLLPSVNPGKTCAASDLMFARLQPHGIFELLSAAAWGRALGYAPDELSGKFLSELMPVENPDVGEVVAALLETRHAQSLDVTLRCKDERRKSFRFHRRFDPRQDAIYLVADEVRRGAAEPYVRKRTDQA
jgi:PAS domain-containing protein